MTRPNSPASAPHPTARPKSWRRLPLLGLLGLAAPLTAIGDVVGTAAEPALTLHYQERPPYSSRDPGGQPQGLLVAPLVRALDRAGVHPQWKMTPSQRQMTTIQSGAGMDCGVGWYRTAEREALGRFSRPIYRDRPFIALVRGDSPLRGDRSVASLLADPALQLLVKDGYSYGAEVDPLLVAHKEALHRTSAESAQMASMIAAGRAGWMILAPEEADILLKNWTGPPGALRQIALPGLGNGPTRHLYCSRRVPEGLMSRIDQALAGR